MKHQNWNKSLEWTEICSKHLLFLVIKQVNVDTTVLLKCFGFWKTFIFIFVKISNHLMQIGLSSRTVAPLLDWVTVTIGTWNVNLVLMSAKTERNCLILRVDSQYCSILCQKLEILKIRSRESLRTTLDIFEIFYPMNLSYKMQNT